MGDNNNSANNTKNIGANTSSEDAKDHGANAKKVDTTVSGLKTIMQVASYYHSIIGLELFIIYVLLVRCKSD